MDAAGCTTIQFPALLAIGLMLIRGRYATHPLIFWLVIVFAVLATWSWKVERSGKRANSMRVAMVLEFARNFVVLGSWVATIAGIIAAFI